MKKMHGVILVVALQMRKKCMKHRNRDDEEKRRQIRLVKDLGRITVHGKASPEAEYPAGLLDMADCSMSDDAPLDRMQSLHDRNRILDHRRCVVRCMRDRNGSFCGRIVVDHDRVGLRASITISFEHLVSFELLTGTF